MNSIFLTTALLVATINDAGAYNSYFTCEAHDALNEGMELMGASVGVGLRNVVVKRGTQVLTSPTEYTPGEVLSVTLSSTVGQLVLENTGGAVFAGGLYCSSSGRNRYIGSASTVTMPVDGSTVELFGGYATTYGAGYVTTFFI